MVKIAKFHVSQGKVKFPQSSGSDYRIMCKLKASTDQMLKYNISTSFTQNSL